MSGFEADTELVKALVNFTSLSASAIAKRAGLAASTLTRPLNSIATTRMSQRTLDQLQAEFPDFPDWPERSEEPRMKPVGEGEMVPIPQLNLSLSMGGGSYIDDYVDEIPVQFEIAYIRAFSRTTPDALRIARGIGDSMAPTLMNNDQVWIDTSQRSLNQQDRIWAITLFGETAAIKRLRRVGPGRILVLSDNPAVPDQEVSADDIAIGGRVIRVMRDL